MHDLDPRNIEPLRFTEDMDKQKGKPKKNPGGRPKSEVDLPDGWESGILEEYKQGASDAEVKALIYSLRGSFSNDLWERWMKQEVKFSETIKKGRMLSEAWWCKEGRKNLKLANFQTGLWSMNMKNRFGWKDKAETTFNAGEGTKIKIEVSSQEIKEKLEKIKPD